MEIGRARTPKIISSNAFHITPPANKSTKRSGIKLPTLPTGCTKDQRTVLGIWLPSTTLATFSVVMVSLLTVHHKYLPARHTSKVKGEERVPKKALMKIPGCNTTKGAVRKGDIIIYYYYCSKKKKIGAREKGVLAPKNKLQHDS